jgi:hypothetical protein
MPRVKPKQAVDLSNYVTLTGTEILSNKSFDEKITINGDTNNWDISVDSTGNLTFETV